MAREVGLRAGEQGTTLNLSYEKLLAGYLQKCAGGESAGRFFWPPDLLLLLAEIQHKRGELALYAGYANAIDDMAEVLDVISASCSFVYGTLVSQLLQLMSLQQRFDFSGILQRSAKLLAAAEAVGFTHLAESIRVRQATTLRCTGQWMETLELLQQLQHTSPLFEPWQLLTRLTAGCEALLASAALLPHTDAITTTATDVVGRFLQEGIRELQVRGYLGMLEEVLQRHFSAKNEGRNESVGVSLPELLCIHASAARSIDIFLSGKFSDPHGISYCSSSIQTCSRQLSEVLCERHQLRHVHEWFSQRGALEICEMLLNGELGMHDS
ncbi:unnamed protein product [Phytomonas sp. EM1]|nr:unnamed protein product [Phytomonas sp. EM1]|eukprot:CCW61057.1 unnamed protein product [Phytomonas sp. isolate EM1]